MGLKIQQFWLKTTNDFRQLSDLHAICPSWRSQSSCWPHGGHMVGTWQVGISVFFGHRQVASSDPVRTFWARQVEPIRTPKKRCAVRRPEDHEGLKHIVRHSSQRDPAGDVRCNAGNRIVNSLPREYNDFWPQDSGYLQNSWFISHSIKSFDNLTGETLSTTILYKGQRLIKSHLTLSALSASEAYWPKDTTGAHITCVVIWPGPACCLATKWRLKLLTTQLPGNSMTICRGTWSSDPWTVGGVNLLKFPEKMVLGCMQQVCPTWWCTDPLVVVYCSE